jgi:hypothetical protein
MLETFIHDARAKWLCVTLGILCGLLSWTAAHADTLKACGLTLEYKVEPPGPDVPAAMRDFSGVWVGAFDYGMCIGMVVESIRPNGTVRLLRFNGSYINSISSVSGRVEGKIVGKALETFNNRFQVAYVVRSPTEISVTANSNQFSQTGKLKRQ